MTRTALWHTQVSAPEAPYSVNSANRMHWAEKGRRSSLWRARGRLAGRRLPARMRGLPYEVRISIPFGNQRRRDPHNYVSTVVKPFIDGLVDAGVWPDDTPDWVTVAEPRLVTDPEVNYRKLWHGWVKVELFAREDE